MIKDFNLHLTRIDDAANDMTFKHAILDYRLTSMRLCMPADDQCGGGCWTRTDKIVIHIFGIKCGAHARRRRGRSSSFTTIKKTFNLILMYLFFINPAMCVQAKANATVCSCSFSLAPFLSILFLNSLYLPYFLRWIRTRRPFLDNANIWQRIKADFSRF